VALVQTLTDGDGDFAFVSGVASDGMPNRSPQGILVERGAAGVFWLIWVGGFPNRVNDEQQVITV